MDGLQYLTAAPVRLELGERTFELRPLTLRSLGEVEREVVRRRLSPLDALADCIDRFAPEHRSRLIDRAVDATARLSRSATQAELAGFLASYEGLCFFFYLATRDAHREIGSVDDARAVLDAVGPVDIARIGQALAQAAGLTELETASKKSPRPADATATPGESPGHDSTSG